MGILFLFKFFNILKIILFKYIMSGITGISSPTGKPYNGKPSKPPSSGITGVSGPTGK
jgi:hypothetical protein